MIEQAMAKATFGGGCFWCTEAVFLRLRGVERVVSGYSGGDVGATSYEAVCSGTTGHAEVIEITFDPRKIAYEELLDVFFHTHDPTTLNRQGADVGTQYRSVIFYHDDEQRMIAERVKKQLDESGAFPGPLVTEISPRENFFPAEDYHQDYFARNARQPYCTFVVAPKVEKVKTKFPDKLKNNS